MLQVTYYDDKKGRITSRPAVESDFIEREEPNIKWESRARFLMVLLVTIGIVVLGIMLRGK